MIKGTTPTHYFTLPISCDDMKNIEITYKQGGKVVLQKYKRDCSVDGCEISVKLTQEETFLFTDNVNVHIQVRVLDNNGDVSITETFCTYCKECFSCEVLK